MLKAIAEGPGSRMPGFFRSVVGSGLILVPLLVAVTFVLFR